MPDAPADENADALIEDEEVLAEDEKDEEQEGEEEDEDDVDEEDEEAPLEP